MPRKSMVQLQADLMTSFPDNTTGAITPAILRSYLNSVIEAIRPAYGYITRPGPTAQSVTTVNAPLVFDTGYLSDVPDYSTTPATGAIDRLEAGTSQILFNADVSGAANTVVTVSLFRNGSATGWNCSATLTGGAEPVSMGFAAIAYFGSPATYQFQVRASGAISVTFSNMTALAETLLVNAY